MRKIAMSMAALAMMLGLTMGNLTGEEASAACAADWTIAGENISFCGGKTKDGAVEAVLEGSFEEGFVSTLILRDYKGELPVVQGYGSGFPVTKYIWQVEGMNEITLENEVILVDLPLEMRGEGRLLVKIAGKDKTDENVAGAISDELIGPEAERETGEERFWHVVEWVYVRVSLVLLVVLAGLGIYYLAHKKPVKATKTPKSTKKSSKSGK